MKHILLPTDFSENSWNAIIYAIQLFRNEECTFHLYNAYTPIIYHVEYVLVNPAQFGLGDRVREASLESLNKLTKRIKKEFKENPNHQFVTVARFDSLVPGIKELVSERHIDLIVMGTQGATGAKEVLFGTNTVHVFKDIKCPVLAIPSEFDFESPQEILLPTDLKLTYQNTHLDLLVDIAVAHHSRVNALHVSNGYTLSEPQQDHKQELEAMFKGTAYLYHEYASMDIEVAVNEFQVKHKINLLVMINNKHSFFENLFFSNTINQIGFHLNVPFMVIPSKIQRAS